jgi:DNA-binding NarL/FixJ family response regulator
VLVLALSAAVFVFLGFRTLFPKPTLVDTIIVDTAAAATTTIDKAPSVDDIFISHSLSERETELARFMIQGLDNKAIADRMHVSESTVVYHVTNIFRKFNIEGKRRPAFLAFFVR